MECVIEPGKIIRKLSADVEKPKALLVVDDLAGTGKTISDSIQKLLDEVESQLATHNIPLFIIILYATEDAEIKIRSVLSKHQKINAQLHICELLTNDERAFPENGIDLWDDQKQRDMAKALCVKLGAGLYKDPLGYDSQGLLIAFPETCPNNCLPIIFASRAGEKPWNAILPRPAS
jgi:hypothetical protein